MNNAFKGCLIFFLVFFSLTVKAQTPLELNDKLSSITDSLYARGQQWGTQFNDAYKAKDFKLLIPYRQALSAYVDKSIARVKVMKDVKNSKPLRMAMIGFLEFEKQMITDGFIPVEKLSPSASDEDMKAALAKLTALSSKENGELQKVAAAQEAYARENGFQIEPAKTEEVGK